MTLLAVGPGPVGLGEESRRARLGADGRAHERIYARVGNRGVVVGLSASSGPLVGVGDDLDALARAQVDCVVASACPAAVPVPAGLRDAAGGGFGRATVGRRSAWDGEARTTKLPPRV